VYFERARTGLAGGRAGLLVCFELEVEICKCPSRLGVIQLKLGPDVTDCLIDVAIVCMQCLECEVQNLFTARMVGIGEVLPRW